MRPPRETGSGAAGACLGAVVLGLLLTGCARPAQTRVPDGPGDPSPISATDDPAPGWGERAESGTTSTGTAEPLTPAMSDPVATAPSPDARRVRVSGSIDVRPDGTVLMCPPVPVPATDTGTDTGCALGAPITGLDISGSSSGVVAVDAWWDGHAFVVITDGPSGGVLSNDPPSGGTSSVPCPEPEGGWSPDDPSWQLEEDTLRNAIGPDYAGQRSVYPDGMPVDGIGRKVVLVSTTGDVAAADAAVRSVYPGNICVTASGWDAATIDRQFEQVKHWAIEGPGARSPAHVFSFGIGADDDGSSRLVVDLLEVTPDVQALLDALGAPAPEVHAWIRPVG